MSEKYASHDSRSAWHHDPENCERVNKPDRHVPRGKEYIQYHDLDPCPYCVPGLKPDRDDEWYDEENLSLAKRIQYGVGD